ncbi:hypothetical protein AGROH133_10033 [Agrobacterium tumefaciens]|nr:hypothetical protein AGROH133_10033 [Agrobacterium tumefaciens]
MISLKLHSGYNLESAPNCKSAASEPRMLPVARSSSSSSAQTCGLSRFRNSTAAITSSSAQCLGSTKRSPEERSGVVSSSFFSVIYASFISIFGLSNRLQAHCGTIYIMLLSSLRQPIVEPLDTIDHLAMFYRYRS